MQQTCNLKNVLIKITSAACLLASSNYALSTAPSNWELASFQKISSYTVCSVNVAKVGGGALPAQAQNGVIFFRLDPDVSGQLGYSFWTSINDDPNDPWTNKRVMQRDGLMSAFLTEKKIQVDLGGDNLEGCGTSGYEIFDMKVLR
jgi:hypothetical protein